MSGLLLGIIIIIIIIIEEIFQFFKPLGRLRGPPTHLFGC
jgi:hypothetical protein